MGTDSGRAYRPCHCGSGKLTKFCCRDHEGSGAPPREGSGFHPGEGSEAPSRGKAEVVLPLPDGLPIFLPPNLASGLSQAEALGCLREGRLDEAMEHVSRAIRLTPRSVVAHYNLALLHSLRGEIEAAVRVLERMVSEIAPKNIQALASLIRNYLILGRRDDALELAARLRPLRPGKRDALYKKCDAFARLGDHETVLEEAEAGLRAFRHPPGIAFFAGTAAANLGRYKDARRHLRRARSKPHHRARAKEYLKLLRRSLGPETIDGDWPYFSFNEWASPGLLKRTKVDEEARRFPGLVEVIVAIINTHPEAAASSVRRLGRIGTPRAVDVLRKIAFGTFGDQAIRMGALGALRGIGELPEGQPVKIWHQGEWREVLLEQTELTEEIPPGVPAEQIPILAEMLSAMGSKEWERALQIGEGLRDMAPEAPVVHQKLGTILQALDRGPEAEVSLRRAFELDRSYLLAPAALMEICLGGGRTAEAREILKGTKLPRKVHPKAYVAYLGACAGLALIDGEVEAVAQTLDALEKTALDADALGGTGEPIALQAARAFAALKERQRRRQEEQRRHLLPPVPSILECLQPCVAAQLMRMARALELADVSSLPKEPLRARIADHLSRPQVITDTLRSLPPAAHRGLFDVWDAGGAMRFDDFTRRHGSEKEEPREAGSDLPETPLGRLKCLGLLAEGTIRGRECVVIPAELRPILSRQISTPPGVPPPPTGPEPAEGPRRSHPLARGPCGDRRAWKSVTVPNILPA